MKKENLIFLSIGLFAGVLFSMSFYDVIEAAIPPTKAISELLVQTSPWAPDDTLVSASKYNDRIYLVSDGSITFNVTSSP